MSDLPLFLGRLHPALVHLPIGLLVAAGGFQGWVWWRRRGGRASRVDAAITPLLGLAAVAAVTAAAAGWLLGTRGGYAGELFERHRALGLGLAAATVLTASARLAVAWWPGRAVRVVYVVLLVQSLALLVGVGHVGGALTHGEGYLLEFAPGWLRTLAGAPEKEAGDDTPPARRVVFETLVQPILARRCVSCHGGESPRGGLGLDTAAGVGAGGENGAVVTAGRPGSSALWRRVSLPPSHPDVMPPRGRPPVTAAEGALLRWWIVEGASLEATLEEVEISAEMRPVVEALLGPLPPEGPTLPPGPVDLADPALVAAAEAAGFSLRPIAEGVPYLRVARVPGSGVVDLTVLEPLRAQVAWLDLGGTDLSDAGLEGVGALQNLIRLDLSLTGVTDAGLGHLSGLAHLETLNLYATAVTDAGLAHLGGLGRLRRLYLWRTNTTSAGVDRLRSALPALEAEPGNEPAASRSD